MSVAPGARVSPRLDALAAAYVSPWRAVEIGAQARVMAFEGERVALLTASLGRYAGAAFVQASVTLVPRAAGRTGAAGGLLVRRYGRVTAMCGEVRLAAGREVLARADGTVDARETASVAVRGQRQFARRLAVSAAVEATLDPSFLRAGAGGGLVVGL